MYKRVIEAGFLFCKMHGVSVVFLQDKHKNKKLTFFPTNLNTAVCNQNINSRYHIYTRTKNHFHKFDLKIVTKLTCF